MSSRTPSIIAVILTILFLILLGVVFMFIEIVALNGFSEQEAMIPLIAMLICQGIGLLFGALVAGWLTRFAITKLNWHKALAVAVAVLAGTLFGGILFVFAIFFSLILISS